MTIRSRVPQCRTDYRLVHGFFVCHVLTTDEPEQIKPVALIRLQEP